MDFSLFFDTCALLNLQQNAFKENFIISQTTLEEIEVIKTSKYKDNDIKCKARHIAALLDQNPYRYQVVRFTDAILCILDDFNLSETSDNIILASAYWYQQNVAPILMCTDDINCRFISKKIFCLETSSSQDLKVLNDNNKYYGYKEITLDDNDMSNLYSHLDQNLYHCLPNEYLIIRKSDGEVVDILKWLPGGFSKVCNKTIRSTLFGDKIKPKDSYQSCAIDSILSNTMTAITGNAGSGKSLISLITIMNLIESGIYDRVIIMFNPTKAKGASDMGYYSGDAIDKAMQNSIGSILTTKFGDRFAVDLLLQQDRIRLVSMADIRGMEVRDNEILYITECQNTSIELLKLCLSRASSGCKIIIEGDYTAQVDSYGFENNCNGMKRAIDVLKGEAEFGYIELKNVWRSRIAELANKL